jgi:DNA-directed RNA polymerase specialized sigma24 family protein
MKLSCCSSSATDVHTDVKNTDIEAILSTHDQYLIKQVQDCMRLHADVVRAEVLDLETDELTQRVRIKFWNALQGKHIEYPKTYLKRIVNSEFIDMVRRIKPNYMLDLPVNEEGELYQGDMLITLSEGMGDPSVEYEEQAEASELLQEAVDAVLTLPARQKHAIICDMRERVDDLEALKKAFKSRKASIEQWQWPQQKSEKLLLRASLTYARLKVGMYMKEGRRSQVIHSACNNRKVIC